MFFTIFVNLRISQSFSISRIDTAAIVFSGNDLLTGIIAVVYHLLFISGYKIPKIPHHYQKQQRKKIGREQDLPILPPSGFPILASPTLLLFFFYFFSLHRISLFALPILSAHLPGSYTVPESQRI